MHDVITDDKPTITGRNIAEITMPYDVIKRERQPAPHSAESASQAGEAKTKSKKEV